MNRTVSVRNRQRTQSVHVGILRQITRTLLTELLQVQSFELTIYVVDASEMTHLNETYLRHQGSTDVLAFDYVETREDGGGTLFGEIFVCTDEAMIQARRFRTNWQAELVRYVVHGTLHLLGHDDHKSEARKRMKQEENRLLNELGNRFELRRIAKAKASNKTWP